MIRSFSNLPSNIVTLLNRLKHRERDEQQHMRIFSKKGRSLEKLIGCNWTIWGSLLLYIANIGAKLQSRFFSPFALIIAHAAGCWFSCVPMQTRCTLQRLNLDQPWCSSLEWHGIDECDTRRCALVNCMSEAVLCVRRLGRTCREEGWVTR